MFVLPNRQRVTELLSFVEACTFGKSRVWAARWWEDNEAVICLEALWRGLEITSTEI